MIHIRIPGLTLIQDTGRHHHTHVGVPVSGAFDAHRHTQARTLLNLDTSAPVFEMLGDILEFTTGDQPVMFSVVGPADVTIDSQTVGANHVIQADTHTTVTVRRNISHTGPIYVAVLGLHAPSTLGSTSHDTLSKLGPAPVSAGDKYLVTAQPNPDLFGRFILPVKHRATLTELRVVPGPHITDVTWPLTATVSTVSRSGIRLTTDQDLPASSANLASLPVMPGVIQLPPSGEPIILGPDSGVTGGYPILGVVITADMPLLARLTHHQRITLRPVDAAHARTITNPLHITSIAEITQL